MQIYVFNKDLEPVGIVENYTSAFWINRYFTNGNCEVCVPASAENLQLFKIGYYLIRYDSDLSCKIQKIEIDTNAQNGNVLIITGIDVKSLLDQRIVWETYETNTATQVLIRSMVYLSTVNTTPERIMTTTQNVGIIGFETPDQSLDGTSAYQVSYKNVGETIRKIVKEKGWGYRLRFGTITTGTPRPGFIFGLYKGADRSESVVFSPIYENLKESKFIIDASNMGNVTLVGGQGQGEERVLADLGATTSIDRYEFFTDAKDIPTTLTWAAFSQAYPLGATGETCYLDYITGRDYKIIVNKMFFPAYSQSQRDALIDEYGSVQYDRQRKSYVVNDAFVATVVSSNGTTPNDDDVVALRDSLYSVYLLNRGAEKIAEHGQKTSFDGVIIPDLTFKFGVDYFLGDIVSVRDEFGNNQAVRVIEVTENETATNKTFEIKFEKLEAE